MEHIDRVRLFSHENYRTAFVLGNEVDYGMGRIVESYTEVQGFPGEYRPFLNLDEAFAWLMSEHKEQFDSSDYAVAFGM